MQQRRPLVTRTRSQTPTARPAPTKLARSSGGPSSNVVELATSLVSLSTNLAETLRSTPRAETPTASSGLRRADVERIVRRTEQHFVPEIERLTAENAELKKQVQTKNERDADSSSEDLRALLQSEKRQRLQCEEQSQRMIEEHAKQVLHLETRIRKLERQLQEASAGCSNRGTPRASRNPTRLDDDLDRVPISPRCPAARVPLPQETNREVTPPQEPSQPLSTSAVNDFLASIGRELDAINAVEASRGQALSAL